MILYDGKGTPMRTEINTNSFKIIAHRGYFANSVENTIASFVEAVEAGFKWIEIDIRKCADGVYVLAHDDTSTLYNNGTAESVTFENSNYANIKNYTWDAEGKFKISTLQATFQTMKAYDVTFICDVKTGSNAEVMEIAGRCGAVDQVQLSYGSFAGAYADAELLRKYPYMSIRCTPSDYENFAKLSTVISNPVFACCSADDYLGASTALSCSIPILFYSCTIANANRWQVIGAGAMAPYGSISYADYLDAFTEIDYNVTHEINPGTAELSLTTGGTAELTAESTLDTPAGYIYSYSQNPSIATVNQTAFGASVTATITGKESGSTDIVLFSGSGEERRIPVTVT